MLLLGEEVRGTWLGEEAHGIISAEGFEWELIMTVDKPGAAREKKRGSLIELKRNARRIKCRAARDVEYDSLPRACEQDPVGITTIFPLLFGLISDHLLFVGRKARSNHSFLFADQTKSPPQHKPIQSSSSP